MMLLTCCCQGCRSVFNVPGYTNTTTVMDYANPPGANIAPYPRPWYFVASGCELVECGEGDPVCATTGYDRSEDRYGGINPGGTVTVNANGYTPTGSNVEITNACFGWKGVLAISTWPGRFGFVNTGNICCPASEKSQSQLRYRGIEFSELVRYHITVVKNNSCGDTPDQTTEYFFETNITQNVMVDRYGNTTRSGSINITTWFKEDGVSQPTPVLNSCDLSDASSIYGVYLTPLQPFDCKCGVINFGTYMGTGHNLPEFIGTAEELNARDDIFAVPAEEDIVPPTGEVDFDPDSHKAQFSASDSTLSVAAQLGYTAFIPRSVTCEPGDYDQDVEIGYEFVYAKTINLTEAISFDQVQSDCVALLAEWNLLDDAVYPWRQDAQTWNVPLVTRDAGANEPTLSFATNEECQYFSDSIFTGALRGAPNPAGYERHFNFDQIVYGSGLSGSACVRCEEERGQRSAWPLPETVTQWTDAFEGGNTHGPGGWVSSSQQPITNTTIDIGPRAGVAMMKWAETIMPWPSLNYARPCGRDRYLFDETAVACVVSFAAPDLEIEAGDVEFSNGDLVAIGTEVYQIASKTDSTHYTVGSLLYNTPVACDGVSKLRFAAARGLCSRRAVAAVQSAPGVVTITLVDKHWLKGGGSASDTVDFTSVAGLGSGLTATVLDDYSFTVPGTLGSFTDGTGFVSSTGAPGGIEAWDTTCPRKIFVTRAWQSRDREFDPEDPEDLPYTLTKAEVGYASSTLASPFIVVISPNAGDTPGKGIRYDFGDIAHDQCFGTTWHRDIVQAVNDPFWQPDHVPCGHSGEWGQATQPCGTDETHYDHPPLVEARLTPPSGAPETPDLVTDGAIPSLTGLPFCESTPYDIGTIHRIRTAWEACVAWIEKTMHRCG